MQYLTEEEIKHQERCRFQNRFSKFTWWKSPGNRFYVVVMVWHDIDTGMVDDIDFLEYGAETPVRVPIDQLRELMAGNSGLTAISKSDSVSFWPLK